MPYEQHIDLPDVAVVLILGFRNVGHSNGIPLVEQDLPDAIVIAPCAIKMPAHEGPFCHVIRLAAAPDACPSPVLSQVLTAETTTVDSALSCSGFSSTTRSGGWETVMGRIRKSSLRESSRGGSGRYGARSRLLPRARNGNRMVMFPDALGHFQGFWHSLENRRVDRRSVVATFLVNAFTTRKSSEGEVQHA